MRVVAWNTGWNVSERVVRRQAEAVVSLGADVTFFSEWSPQKDRVTSAGEIRSSSGHLRGAEMARIGLPHQQHEHLSDRRDDGLAWSGAFWGVLAASRRPITKKLRMPPLFAPGYWLEVAHEDSGLTLVGVRMPAWDGRRVHLRRELWIWMLQQFDRLASTPTIVLGDFNTERAYPSPSTDFKYCGDLLRSVTAVRGWKDPYAVIGTSEQPTFWHRQSCRRIDHALVSPAFKGSIDRIDAPTSVGALVLSGPSRADDGHQRGRLSDHAPLVIDVTPSGARRLNPDRSRVWVS